MDVKVRVLYAWPNDQLSPDLADLWPNVGMAMAILDFMSIGIDTKRDWQIKILFVVFTFKNLAGDLLSLNELANLK